MGYSYAAKAGFSLDRLIERLQNDGKYKGRSSNVWTVNGIEYFWERGREQADGSMTGTVRKGVGGGLSKLAGSFKINSDGVIARFPSTNAKQRKESAELGLKDFNERYVLQMAV